MHHCAQALSKRRRHRTRRREGGTNASDKRTWSMHYSWGRDFAQHTAQAKQGCGWQAAHCPEKNHSCLFSFFSLVKHSPYIKNSPLLSNLSARPGFSLVNQFSQTRKKSKLAEPLFSHQISLTRFLEPDFLNLTSKNCKNWGHRIKGCLAIPYNI